MLLLIRQVAPAARRIQHRSTVRQRKSPSFTPRNCSALRFSFTPLATSVEREENAEHRTCVDELKFLQATTRFPRFFSFYDCNGYGSSNPRRNHVYRLSLVPTLRQHGFHNEHNYDSYSDLRSLSAQSRCRKERKNRNSNVSEFSTPEAGSFLQGISSGFESSSARAEINGNIMTSIHQSLQLRKQDQGHMWLARAYFSSSGSGFDYKTISKSGIKKTKIPTPASGPAMPPTPETMQPQEIANEITKRFRGSVIPALMNGAKSLGSVIINLPGTLLYYITHPSELAKRWNALKKVVEDEISHYWVGTKLLWADIKTAKNLLQKTLRGSFLTRRERKQLLRTVSDIFRLVPFSIFMIIPLMEFALPFALKIFPNMLPSTFQDSLKAEENMKRELKSRIAMTKFFQETLEELAKEQKRKAAIKKQEIKESGDDVCDNIVVKQEETAVSMLEFLEKARNGEVMPPDVIVKYANYFQDDLTLDNMPRMQLVNMCRYMAIPPYGSDSFLSFQLRHKIRSLKEDDQRILWEGIDSLTKMELREACQERGMRSTGLSKDAYKRALQQWLDLSVHKSLPVSLLIMSRTFFLREEMFSREDTGKSLTGLADAISGMDKEVVNEVILEVATSEERMSDPSVRKIQLEVLTQQNERIKEEEEAREERAKKKEAAGREKQEMESVDALELFSEARDTLSSANDGFSDPSLSPEDSKSIDRKSAEEEEDRDDLSPDELDAISQLVSSDPVHKERAELESIKAAMSEKIEPSEDQAPDLSQTISESPLHTMTMDMPLQKEELEKYFIEDNPISAKPEDKESTKPSVDSGTEIVQPEAPSTEAEDPVVARLKKRVEKMVDKIEVQLSDVQVKIGDKLHFLDKDMDGIMTREEFAESIQHVLKREISLEEAQEFAKDVDYNGDGKIEVQELIKWIETNTMVKFVEEGRDADMDRILEKQCSEIQSEDQLVPKHNRSS